MEIALRFLCYSEKKRASLFRYSAKFYSMEINLYADTTLAVTEQSISN